MELEKKKEIYPLTMDEKNKYSPPQPSGLEEKPTFPKYITSDLIPRQEHVTISQGER